MNASLRIACTLTMLLLSAHVAVGQGHDSQGREFWISFLENYGSGGGAEQSDLRLYAASNGPTTLRVLYHATGDERQIVIPSGGLPIEIDVRALFGDIEITGSEELSRKSLLVRSDDDITLYGVNVRRMSSDAFLALPADVFTRRYVVLAYQNGVSSDAQGFYEVDMPSQFCVIATEDGTTVRIDPSAPIVARGSRPFTVELDRGEVYFAQAELDAEWDLSGTAVQSTKPVAVFAGVRRTAIPADVGNFRDHLIEQMPPVEVWGREAIVTPHFPVTPASREIAIVRVLAASDNTEWAIDGVRQTPLARARAVELPLTRAMRITADRPILVAQYEHSVNASDSISEEFELGDPFMMLVPPPEQFDTSYGFQSVGHQEFLRHFINIVIPRAGLASLELDGTPVTGAFVPIPGSIYGYVQYELDAGAHVIRSDSAFGLFAYGYGRANSYGYVGGMAYRRFVHDYEPPSIEQVVECGHLRGVVADDRVTDTGIDSCYALAESRNVRVVIEPFESAADSVFYSAELADPWRDGMVAIRAIDSTGRSRTQTTPIAGFTVRIAGAPDDGSLALDTLRTFNGATGCGEVEVTNDGLYEQTITDIRFAPASPSMLATTALPITLKPGERAVVRYCASWPGDTVMSARIIIGTGCVDRPLATVTLDSRTDTLGPDPMVERGGCAGELSLRFVEAGRSSSGIAAMELTRLANCRVESRVPERITGAIGELRCRLVVLDARYDAFVEGWVEDVAGNRETFVDTIGGFTCAIVDGPLDTISVSRGAGWRAAGLVYGDQRCDTLTVVNYGVRPVRITRATLDDNRAMSVPPSQLPMTVLPGERRPIVVCLEGRGGDEVDDTLALVDDCGHVERAALAARVAPIVVGGADRCNNALSIRSVGAARRTFLAPPLPNPSAGGPVAIDVGLAAGGAVSLELFDADGRPASTILRNEPLEAGLHRVVADLSRLGTGRYFLRLSIGEDVLVEPVVVMR